MGDYDEDGNPTICYTERVYRVFKQRRKRKSTSNTTSDSIGEDSYDTKQMLCYLTEWSSSESSSSESCMSSSTEDTVNTCKTKWLIFSSLLILGLILPIIFYHLDVISFERPTNSDPVPTSPVYHKCTNQRFENLMMHIEKLQTKLHSVKEILNYQLPNANFWTNFALEFHGAKVYKKRSSSTYERIAGIKILGIQLFSKVVPVTVIQGQHPPIPGNCWSFPGSHGNLFIELSHNITVSHVTLDHISKSVSPIDTIPSAPRHFVVYGLQSLDEKAVHLGKFIYDLDGNPTQTFAVKDHDSIPFKYVDLRIESNYGHADYTCLYGFRVHGRI
ncbi:SUN domain-containing protein 2-like [Takifugu flavidus]|uniref:SUN domain-containing protein 2-like n=1 Tax=Takifugu flavidus TaxID=433684 RepID=UPI00254475FC|nr:SUN domain-containing protein 2-like [Takifugu flavidus]